MNSTQVFNIIEELKSSLLSNNVKLIETHISWVILTAQFVYKIKKPLKYSFLDFSTLEKRRFYCSRELELNQRLTNDMYLDVVDIRSAGDRILIDGGRGEIIDYAVKMKRMDETKQMNLLLIKNEVTPEHMDQIADMLSTFHAFTDTFEQPVSIDLMISDFEDILDAGDKHAVQKAIKEKLGLEAFQTIEEAVAFSSAFLRKHASRLTERCRMGFIIDGHGDLHSKNIFLLDQPVIFDCIEFNDHFRHLDVLDELAFFCVDLDLYDKPELAQRFLQKYFVNYPCLFGPEDRSLFLYYKLYRANVKVKVNILKALQATNERVYDRRLVLASKYYNLMESYFHEFHI